LFAAVAMPVPMFFREISNWPSEVVPPVTWDLSHAWFTSQPTE